MITSFKNFRRLLKVAIAAGALLFASTVTHAQTAGKPIRIGWTAWSDAEVVTNIAKQILEKRLGYKVELVMTDIGLQYQGVAKGQLDLMLMSWLPTTHKSYWDKFRKEVVDLGPLYSNAKIGWAVPTYIPESELKTVADLLKPNVQQKLGGKIQGIDPGSGLMNASAATIKAYGLDKYNLITGSDAAMVVALDRAINRKEWIVVTAWTPHWMFSKYPLRYLEDPKGALGGAEKIHALSRIGFDKDFPKAAAFIRNFKISIPDLEATMLKAKSSSYEKEATNFINSHPDLVNAWLKDSK